MSKKSLTEADIRTKFITPSIISAGWNIDTQVREEVHFTDGRIYVRGRIHTRGERKRADYILYYKPNIPVAIIEAKDNNHSVSSGIQQALGYAVTLDIPFVFSSNGDGFYFHDRTAKDGSIEKEVPLDAFPSPQELWQKYRAYKGLADEVDPIVSQDYFLDGTGRTPRYYQQTAINRTVETIAKNESGNRHLLVMATGTGKTYTAALGERAAEVNALINLLLLGSSPSDEDIVYEARENWHASKLEIERDKFFKGLEWIRKQGLIPEGKGRYVDVKNERKSTRKPT